MTKNTTSDDVMHTKYFSLSPLTIELKEIFEIPADPNSDNPNEVKEALDYLKNLGIFFYQDEELTEGIIIEPDDGLGPIQERHGFQAFKHSCILDMENLSVVDWEDLEDPRVKEKGPKAWMEFNKPVVIEQLRPDRVALG